MAQGGTLFFDEIGDIEYALEKKLLRFLQEREVRRVGGKQKMHVDARVLSATNRDLETEVERGEFRSDLFYRLNVITIRIPPLRERTEDIPLLAQHYLNHFNTKNKKDIRAFEPDVLDVLQNYEWPGNVRELENVVERAVILCSYDSINIECLPCKLKVINDEVCRRPDEFNLLEIEKRIITKALDSTSWNQSRAAVLLGISRKQLRTKMKNLGLMNK